MQHFSLNPGIVRARPNRFSLLLAVLLIPSWCFGIATWIGPATVSFSAYSTASNWSPTGVPASSEQIVFTYSVAISQTLPTNSGNDLRINPGATVTVNSGVSLTVGSITLNANTPTPSSSFAGLVNNGTLTGTNFTYPNGNGSSATNNGTLNLTNLNTGNSTNAGTFSNTGTLNVVNNVIVEEGIFSNSSTATVNTNGIVIQSGGTINNSGNISSIGTTSSAQVSINSGGTLNNLSGGVLKIDLGTSNVKALDVSGTFVNASGAAVYIGSSPVQTGSDGAIARSGANFSNSGTMVFDIDPTNCVIVNNTGASGSFSTVAVTARSGSGSAPPCPSAIPTAVSALSVKLVSFSAHADNQGTLVTLNWTTASENGGSMFRVQESIDGMNFATIGTVPCRHFAGAADYEYKAPVTGKSNKIYYRLQILEQDGSSTTSPTATVLISVDKKDVIVAPNPVSSTVKISNLQSDMSYTANVYAIDGRLLISRVKEAGSANFQIDMSKLPGGLYRLSILGNGGVVKSMSISKEQ